MYEGVSSTRLVQDRFPWRVIVAFSVRKLWEDFWPHGPLATIAEVVMSVQCKCMYTCCGTYYRQ
jgi:hypothetical protein